jgi:DeoR family transcriptional regulator, fructose operon transcriptional repressor
MVPQPKPENALPAKRHAELLQLLQSRGQMSVRDLAAHFEISDDTVRRDLDLLAGQNLLTRTHGGAVALTALVHRDSTFMQRIGTRTQEKRRIASAATELIEDGETLLINGGSTTRLFAAQLKRRNITVVTNNLSVPGALSPDVARDVYLLGGHYQEDAQVTIGPVAALGIPISVDTAIIGVGGITAREGLSTTVLEEASMIASMIAVARRTVVLADASKLGKCSFAQIGPLSSMQILISDTSPDPDLTKALAEAEVQFILASAQ